MELEVGVAVGTGQSGDGLAQRLGELQRFMTLQADQQQGELSIPEAGDIVLLALQTPQQSHDTLQQLVAGVVAPAVVHRPQVVDVDAEQRQRQVFAAGAADLMAADRQEGVAGGQTGDRAEAGLAAQLDLMHHHLGQQGQLALLLGRDLPRLAIDHAEGAEIVTLGAVQRCTRVEADVGSGGDERIAAEAGIGSGIRNHHHAIGGDGVGTEGLIAGRFARLQPEVAEKPLAVLFHQGDRRDRHRKDQAGQLDDALEMLIAGAVDDAVPLQLPQPLQLIGGDRIAQGGVHGVPPGVLNPRKSTRQRRGKGCAGTPRHARQRTAVSFPPVAAAVAGQGGPWEQPRGSSTVAAAGGPPATLPRGLGRAGPGPEESVRPPRARCVVPFRSPDRGEPAVRHHGDPALTKGSARQVTENGGRSGEGLPWHPG